MPSENPLVAKIRLDGRFYNTPYKYFVLRYSRAHLVSVPVALPLCYRQYEDFQLCGVNTPKIVVLDQNKYVPYVL